MRRKKKWNRILGRERIQLAKEPVISGALQEHGQQAGIGQRMYCLCIQGWKSLEGGGFVGIYSGTFSRGPPGLSHHQHVTQLVLTAFSALVLHLWLKTTAPCPGSLLSTNSFDTPPHCPFTHCSVPLSFIYLQAVLVSYLKYSWYLLSSAP